MKVAVFDFETSGLVPTDNRVIELAFIKVLDGVITQQHSLLLNNEIEIDEKITELTGITKDMIDADGASPEKAFKAFLLSVSDTDLIIGHNIFNFDVPFLEASANRCRITNLLPTHDKYYDTAGVFKAKELGFKQTSAETHREYCQKAFDQRIKGLKFSIPVCCQKFGISTEGVQMHRALADVLLTWEIYKKLAEETEGI